MMPRLDPTTRDVAITECGSAWQYYAEKAEKTTLQTIGANVDNDQITDAEFRGFVRRAIRPRAASSGKPIDTEQADEQQRPARRNGGPQAGAAEHRKSARSGSET